MRSSCLRVWLLFLALCAFAAPGRTNPWTEDFESYAAGDTVDGHNGWDWDLNSGTANVIPDGASGRGLRTTNTGTAPYTRFVGSIQWLGPFAPVQTWTFRARIPTVNGVVRATNVYLDHYADGGGRAFRITLHGRTAATMGLSHNGPAGWKTGPEMAADVWHAFRVSLDTAASPSRYRVEVTDIGWDSGWWNAYGAYSGLSGITFLQENTDGAGVAAPSSVDWDDMAGPEPLPAADVLYTLSKPGDYPGQVFAASVQGLANRHTARLFVFSGNSYDTTWLSRSTGPGRWLAGKVRVALPNANVGPLIDAFRPQIRGVVVWDRNVPATVNAATTAAGVLDAAVVMGDAAPGSPFDVAVNQKKLPVLVDLRGRFTGAGTIWETALPSTGSAKVDATLWARAKFLDTGLCDPTLLGLTEDAYAFVKGTEIIHTLDRDILVARRGFCVDLNPWPNEQANDEPGQPHGMEYPAYVSILQSAREKAGGRVIDMIGYLPYKDKYADNHGGHSTGGGGSAEGPGEWQNVRLLSQYGGTLWAEQNCPNMSFWRHAPAVGYMPQNARPLPRTPENKTYVLFMNGDWDGPTGIYEFSPEFWDKPFRASAARDVPIAWSFNPNNALLFPEQFRHFWSTRSAHDFFVGSASGAGYSMPNYLGGPAMDDYAARARRVYGLLDVSVALFNIDVSPPSGNTLATYATFAGDGYGYTYVPGETLSPPAPGVSTVNDAVVEPGHMPVVNLFSITGQGYGGRNLDDSVTFAANVIYGIVPRFGSTLGRQPNFLALRSNGSVEFFQKLKDHLQQDKPDHRYEPVDPFTFFYLRRLTLGSQNTQRHTVLSAPAEINVAANRPFTVPLALRNNGWDTWGTDMTAEAMVGTGEGGAWSFALPVETPPGGTLSLSLPLVAPPASGRHTLMVDLGLYGDMHGNNGAAPYAATLNVLAPADAAAVLRAASGLAAETPENLARLDMDRDGRLSLADAALITRFTR